MIKPEDLFVPSLSKLGDRPWSVRCSVSIGKLLMLLTSPSTREPEKHTGDGIRERVSDQMLWRCTESLSDHREVGWNMLFIIRGVFGPCVSSLVAVSETWL